MWPRSAGPRMRALNAPLTSNKAWLTTAAAAVLSVALRAGLANAARPRRGASHEALTHSLPCRASAAC